MESNLKEALQAEGTARPEAEKAERGAEGREAGGEELQCSGCP